MEVGNQARDAEDVITSMVPYHAYLKRLYSLFWANSR